MAKKIPDNLKEPSDKINRGNELSRSDDRVKNVSIGLLDIDSAIFYYFENVIKPIIKENGEQVKVPLIYANPERWLAIQKQGVIRNNKRKVMAPVIAFRRTGFSKDETVPVDKLDPLSPKVHYHYEKQYTSENRYDRFSAMKGITPKREMYSVAVPDYVTLSYDFIIWTNFTDQMNHIVEKINWSEGSYWGEPGKFRFRSNIENFEDASEYEDSTRKIKTSFSVILSGYLVPDSFNDIVTTQKFVTPKQIVISDGTDLNITSLTKTDEGVQTINVVTNLGDVGSGGGGGTNTNLQLNSGDNIVFSSFIYNGLTEINRTIATSLTPTFTTVSTDTLVATGDITTLTNLNISGSTHVTGSIYTHGEGRIYEQGTSVVDHATAMAIVFGG